MYIIFGFKKQNNVPDTTKPVSVTLSDDIAFTNAINQVGTIHYAYRRVTDGDSSIIRAALNNPNSVVVTLSPTDPEKIQAITHKQNADNGPYSRKLVDAHPTVRPAAYRAAATSFFKNL